MVNLLFRNSQDLAEVTLNSRFHGTVSLDVEDCKSSYPQPGQWSVREPAPYDDLRNSWRLILQAALRLNDASQSCAEGRARIAVQLRDDNAAEHCARALAFHENNPQLQLRMIATAVGLLTIVLAVYLQVREPRRWLKRLGWIALTGVIAQGLLGGLTGCGLSNSIASSR